MAGAAGQPSFDLTADLLENGERFSFFQVLRLLGVLGRGERGAEQPGATGGASVRVRPELSLGFPAADVAAVERQPSGRAEFLVTATFLGLYGSSSPLPTFYTEDLLAEAAEDASVTRDFLDVVNEHLYHLLFRCWARNRLPLRVAEENDAAELERLLSFPGFAEEGLREDFPRARALLRYAGLFTLFPRSAAGLEAMLRDALGADGLEVVPCILARVAIPEDQRLSLGASGCALGVDSLVGEEMWDRSGRFRIRIGPLDRWQLQSLLPGRPEQEWLAALTRLYLTDPLDFDFELTLKAGEARPACLGAPDWARLGIDTWVFAGEHWEESHLTFPPPEVMRR